VKVAIIHDWLTGMRGGERCLLSFIRMYPQADVFTLIHVKGATHPEIDARVKATSFLQYFPKVEKYYRYLLGLFPLAIRGFDLKGYDLVISLSHAAAKNVPVPRGIPHICYCFTPMRYIWDQANSYFGKLTPFLWPIITYLRRWDLEGQKRVNIFVAISKFVAARIRCYYRSDSEVIFPPVDTSWIRPTQPHIKGKAFLYAGALVPYKRVDLVIEAFNKLGQELWIAGGGPEEKKLRLIAKSNIKFFGKLSDPELAECFRNCRALIFPGTEDFGLIPIECMAAGRPVIALYDGALKESHLGVRYWLPKAIQPSESTGVFIPKRPGQEVGALVESVRYFIDNEDCFESSVCLDRARVFGVEAFQDNWNVLLKKLGLPRIETSQVVNKVLVA